MRKLLIWFLALMVVAVIAGPMPAAADEMEDEIAALKAQIADMQGRLEALEVKKETKVAAPATALPGNLTFNGYFRGRYQIAQADRNSFDATEFAIHPQWDASDRVHGEAHLWFYPFLNSMDSLTFTQNFYLESALMTIDGMGWGPGSKLIAGKTRNWAYGITPSDENRLVSNYSIYSESFHRSRIHGLQLFNSNDNGKIKVNIALMNGYSLVTNRYIGTAPQRIWAIAAPDTATAMIASGENPLDNNDRMGGSIRISGDVSHDLNVGFSFLASRLTDTESALVSSYVADPGGRKTRRHIGFDFRYKDHPWIWQFEYTRADLANLDYYGFQTLLGIDLDEINSLYLQYAKLDYDDINFGGNDINANAISGLTQTWDKEQFTFSLKHRIAPKAWLQFEHEINIEAAPTGQKDIDNDLTFLEYYVGY